jgi:hypothetical protein
MEFINCDIKLWDLLDTAVVKERIQISTYYWLVFWIVILIVSKIFVRDIGKLFKNIVMNSGKILVHTDPVLLMQAFSFTVSGRSCTTCGVFCVRNLALYFLRR